MASVHPDILIRVRDLVVGFGDQLVLDHLSLDVRRGEVLGLVGASGGGKTVLLRTIIGLIPKRQGHIEIMGVDRIRRAPSRREPSNGAGASYFSKVLCFPHSPSGKTFNSRCGKIFISPNL